MLQKFKITSYAFILFLVFAFSFIALQVATVEASHDQAHVDATRAEEDRALKATRDAEDNALEAVRNQEDSDRQAAAEAQAATPGMPSQADGFCMTEDACAAAAEDAGANVG